ncbi:hypothetical protein SpCBS45565_g08385 [Spizellomyces sp. 'palustris']|nr:hypothetical protein SpCBS45565_g08385 [Spizellomyces sp. 'palustris']
MSFPIETPFPLDIPTTVRPVSHHTDSTAPLPTHSRSPPLSGNVGLSKLYPPSFILWRLLNDGRILELRRVFTASHREDGIPLDIQNDLPTVTHTNTPVQITFPTPICPTPRVYLSNDGSEVRFQGVSACGTLWTASFPTPDVFYEQGWRRRVVKKYGIKLVSGQRVRVVQFPDERCVVVGCEGGAVVVVERKGVGQDEEETYLEHQLVETNYIQQLKSATPARIKNFLSPFLGASRDTTPASTDGRQPIALNSVRFYEFVLCRDRQLQIWNLKTRSKWKTIALPLDEPQRMDSAKGEPKMGHLADPTPRHYIQVFDLEQYETVMGAFSMRGVEFKVAVYVPPAEDADPFFAIYRGRIDQYGDMQEFALACTKHVPFSEEESVPQEGSTSQQMSIRSTRPETLIDFVIVDKAMTANAYAWWIWGLWERGGESVARFTQLWQVDADDPNAVISPKTSEGRWTTVLQGCSKPLDLTAGLSETDILDFICSRERYSESTVFKALGWYETQTAAMFRDGRRTKGDRPEALRQAVQQVIMPEGERDGEVASSLKKLIQLCDDVHKLGNTPCAIEYDRSAGSITIIKRGVLVAVRDSDPAELIRGIQTGAVDPADFAIFGSPAMDEGASSFFANPELREGLTAFLGVVEWVRTHVPLSALRGIENRVKMIVADGGGQDVSALSSQLLREFLHPLTTSVDFTKFEQRYRNIPPRFVESFVQLLRGMSGRDLLDMMGAVPGTSSVFSNTMIATAFERIATDRYRMIKDTLMVLLVALFVCKEVVGGDVLSVCFSGYYAWRAAYWMGVTRVQGATTPLGPSLPQPERIVTHLLSHYYRPPLDFEATDYTALIPKAVGWFSWSAGFSGPDFGEVARVANRIIGLGTPESVREIVFGLPPSAAVAYLRGRVCVEEQDWDAAKRNFEDAVMSFGENVPLAGNDLRVILPDEVIDGGRTAYYRHLTDLFMEKGAKVLVIKYGKEVLQRLTGETAGVNKLSEAYIKSLRKAIFMYSLDLKSWQDAHKSVLTMPDRATRLVWLKSFVSALAENNCIDELCNGLTFNGLIEEVEYELIAKTRVTSIERGVKETGPNWHRILYTFYISRGDYRNAASTMYIYAHRLNRLSEGLHGTGVSMHKVLVEQARSYLAAVTALSMVPEDFCWLVAPERDGELGAERVRKRRRDESDQRRRHCMSIIQLPDLRKESALAHAKLHLHSPDLDQVSVGLPYPEDALVLYVEREMYEEAFTLGRLFELDLTRVFESLVEGCVWMDRGATGGISASDTTVSSDHAWDALKKYLDRHDGEETGFKYRKAVIDRALFCDREVKLPLWLTRVYKTQFPDDLIRIYLKHDLGDQAAKFTIQYIQEQQHPRPTHHTFTRWLPYTLIDRIISDLQQRNDKRDQDVLDALTQYFGFVGAESEEVLRGYAGKIGINQGECEVLSKSMFL